MMSEERTPQTQDEPQMIFRAHVRYLLLAVLSLSASLMLLLEMRQGMRWDTALFALIGLAGGLWAAWMASTRIELTADALILHRLYFSQRVNFSQIISVSTQGRLLTVLTLLYHPRQANGLVDTDSVRSLLAPGVANQEALLSALESRRPA